MPYPGMLMGRVHLLADHGRLRGHTVLLTPLPALAPPLPARSSEFHFLFSLPDRVRGSGGKSIARRTCTARTSCSTSSGVASVALTVKVREAVAVKRSENFEKIQHPAVILGSSI